MPTHDTVIRLGAPGHKSVRVDGRDLTGAVRGLTIEDTATALSRVTLDLQTHPIEVDGEMTVTVPDPTKDALAALGWATPEQLAGAYRERARLVAHLAACYPGAVLSFSDPAAPGWAVITIETPAGQMSWHIAAEDLDLFPETLVARVHAEDPRAKWDGHDTPTKYDRLTELTARTHYERRAAQAG